MSVLDRVAKLASTAATTRGERDLAAWQTWKKSPTDQNLSEVLKLVDPLVQREVNKWSGTLARPLLETEGRRLAVEAFQSYNPNMGAALGTHVANSLLKMSRLSYAHQNVARLPENKMLAFHTYNVAHAQLSDELGRTPTVDELADNLGWSVPHLTDFRKQISRRELLESGGTSTGEGNAGPMFDTEETDHTVHFIHHDLPPVQKSIFEHLTGYGGTPILSNNEIQKKLKLTQGQYSYQKQKLLAHVESVVGGK